TFVGGGTRYYPYALHVNAPINGALQFNNWINQEMAFKIISTVYIYSNTYYITNVGANWYPEMLEHYVGISFIDLDEKLHYGWIRCDVTNEGRILVIKDYAYESKPNTSIKAGDIVGDTTKRNVEINIEDLTTVGTSEYQLLNRVTCYTFNSNLYISIDNNNEAYIVKITNLAGATVMENTFNNPHKVIGLNELPKGIYVVSILLNNQIAYFKIGN
ncbi:MAG: T9SS type A sorting domain-containing protein, partial [Chitinophagales bacterium]